MNPEERKFLHDIATPIAIALATVDNLVEAERAAAAPDSSRLSQLERAQRALRKLRDSLEARREAVRQPADGPA